MLETTVSVSFVPQTKTERTKLISANQPSYKLLKFNDLLVMKKNTRDSIFTAVTREEKEKKQEKTEENQNQLIIPPPKKAKTHFFPNTHINGSFT